MTEVELSDYVEFWYGEQCRTLSEKSKGFRSKDELSIAIYDDFVELDSGITEKIKAAIASL